MQKPENDTLGQDAADQDEATDAPSTGSSRLSASGRALSPRWLQIVSVIWVGQAASIITSGASGWAIIWHVVQNEQSAFALALVMVASMLPQGLLAPFGGVAADRFNRKALMVVADLGAGLASLALALVVLLFGNASLASICFFGALRSAFSAFHAPAMMAAMPMLVPERHLLRINSLDQLIGSIAGICGPAIGIGLYVAAGLPFTLALEFAGALLAVFALFFVKIPTVRSETSVGALRQMSESWQALKKHKGLVMILGGLTVGMMAFSAVSAIFPLMGTQHFGANGTMISVSEAVMGACMLIGAVIIMAWGGGHRLAGLLCASSVLVGVPTAVAGMLPPEGFWAFVAAMSFAAVFMAWFNGPVLTLVQQRFPEEQTGRIMGFIFAIIGIASPVGVALGGALAEWMGIAPFFVASGTLFSILGAVGYLFKDIRALDAERG